MNATQTKTKIERLKVYIQKTHALISQATDAEKVAFFQREVRKAQAVIDQLNK